MTKHWRHTRSRARWRSTAYAVLLLVASCGGDEVQVAPIPSVPTTITISPATATLVSLGETVRLTATVRDQDGQSMTGITVTWASSDASVARVAGDGTVSAAANGTATVTATVGGISAGADITVEQRAASLNAVSGDQQEGIRGHLLDEPLVVRVEDDGGSGVAGVSVTFSPGAESGTVSPETSATGADGHASTEWTLGNGRTQSMAVSVAGGLATEFSAGLVSGPYQCEAPTQPTIALELPLRDMSTWNHMSL